MFRYSTAFLAGAYSNRGGVVEIDVSAVFPLLYLSQVSKITSALIARHDDTLFWISAGTNKDNLERP